MKLILSAKSSEDLSMQLMALACNLASNPENAARMCEGPGLKLLVKRAVKQRDPLLMKMLRNISLHEGPTKELFLDHVDRLAGLVQSDTDDDLLVEVVGLLGNLTIEDFDYSKLLLE